MKYLVLSLFGCLAWAQPAEVIMNPKLEHSCLKPSKSVPLEKEIPEASGLAAWNGRLWTHNDSGKAQLFALDTATGEIVETYNLPGLKNRDWEDMGQDENYLYLGNFGNNAHRMDTLQIYRIDKASLLRKDPSVATIAFSWPETISDGKREKINFDCEAMVVIGDSICLFTKEWRHGHRSRLFTIPKTPGTWTANYRYTLKTRILVTGASYDADTKQLVLCGYNIQLRPFLLVFPGTSGTDFFSNPGKKVKLRKRFRQVEGIATFDGTHYYAVNEDFRYLFLHTGPELHRFYLKK